MLVARIYVCRATCNGRRMLGAWAYNLDAREAHLVPAAAAFPAIRGSVGWDDIEIGVASGMTWAEAVTRALLDWCRQIALCEMQGASEDDIPAGGPSSPYL